MKPTVGDRTTRWEITAAAIPGALAIAVLFHLWPTGRFLQRTWLGMPVHELGHAVTSWWCGYGAIPTLWKTLVPEERGVVWVLVAALEGGLFWIGWQRTWMALAAARGRTAPFACKTLTSLGAHGHWDRELVARDAARDGECVGAADERARARDVGGDRERVD